MKYYVEFRDKDGFYRCGGSWNSVVTKPTQREVVKYADELFDSNKMSGYRISEFAYGNKPVLKEVEWK